MPDLPIYDEDDLGCPHCGERCDVCVDTLAELERHREYQRGAECTIAQLRRERDEARAEVERLQWAVVLLRAGAEDIARGDYANSLARRTAQQMLSDTNDPD